MAKFSLSLTELTRGVTQQTPRARALWGDMYEDPAEKVLSVMYISLGDTARKQFKYKHHITTLWDSKAAELSRLTNECFQVNRNCTLGGHRSFSQLQQPGKSP